MRKQDPLDEPDLPLVDTTAALQLHSKRLERRQKKLQLKEAASKQHATLWDLPSELILEILSLLRPSDIFNLLRVNQGFRNYILNEESRIAVEVIEKRYSVLTKCFPRPILLENVPETAHAALLDEERQAIHLHIHKKPYQHVKPPDPHTICTCLTCALAWNNLNVIVDFAHWQIKLNQGEPIPMIPRGQIAQWNENLVTRNGEVVQKALYSSLWYARILEAHLKSTVGSILRHSNNRGNKRRRFRMLSEDVVAENDLFLQRSGPPSLDFPYHRDTFYLLETFTPNRSWNSEAGEWRYMPNTQHDQDVEFVKAWAKRRKEAALKDANTTKQLS